MTASRLMTFVAAGVLLLFGVLYLWGSFDPQGQAVWVVAAILCFASGAGCLWVGVRRLQR